jgi:hypothetical protein
VRHHGGHATGALQHGQHVLNEHQVRFLALVGHPDREPTTEFDSIRVVVLAKRRVGEHSVVPSQFAVAVAMLRLGDRVFLPNVS